MPPEETTSVHRPSKAQMIEACIDTDSFYTMQVHPVDKSQHHSSLQVLVWPHSVSFPVGLTWLDIDRSANIRIRAHTTDKDSPSSPASVRVHLDSWGDTTLYSAGCTWLQVHAGDRDFQSGTFSTTDDHPPNRPQTTTCRRITFEQPYAAKPKVVVWLSQLDMSKNRNWRVKAYASDVSKTGFKLHIDTWGDTILYSGAASWIAHPANRSNITSGTYNTMEVRPWNVPEHVNEKCVEFDRPFESPPRVLAALNWLDVSNEANLRVKMAQMDVTTKGMVLSIDSWGDTVMYSAGAAYLAIQDF